MGHRCDTWMRWLLLGFACSLSVACPPNETAESESTGELPVDSDSVDSEPTGDSTPPVKIHTGDTAVELPVVLEYGTVSYTEDSSNFASPERGFYHYSLVDVDDYASGALQESTLVSYRQNEAITLIFRYFGLGAYLDAPLPDDVLLEMDADFATLRAAGLKVVVRFRYTDDATSPYGDATPDRTFEHLEQVGPVLQANADVILTVQAGFIGAWGEWYYSDHWGDLGVWDAEDHENRAALVAALLEAVPEERTVQLRTPAYRTTFYGDDHACFDGSDLSRIGHHNDCFLASETDWGTYSDAKTQYPWLSEDTQCTPMGGETCHDSGERAECESALEELAMFHWTYLNIDYHPDVLSGWEAGGCLDTVRQRLGYRLVLEATTLPSRAEPGATGTVTVQIRNDGFAAPINPRNAELVLLAPDGGEAWRQVLDVDPRRWLPEHGTITFSEDIELPEALAEGEYTWALHLADPTDSLHDFAVFAIRLANDEIWDPDTGLNALGLSLTVE